MDKKDVKYYQNSIEIEVTGKGFITRYKNEIVQYSECDTHSETCTVHYKDGSSYKLNTECSIYNLPYGIPISEDGQLLFACHWWMGMKAIKIITGETVWKLKPRLAETFVYSDYLVALKMDLAIYKVAVQSGEIIGKISGTAIANIFDLGNGNILADSLRGKMCVIDTKKMQVTKEYNKTITNPRKCLYQRFTKAILEDRKLIVLGFESGAEKDMYDHKTLEFSRVIDTEYE